MSVHGFKNYDPYNISHGVSPVKYVWPGKDQYSLNFLIHLGLRGHEIHSEHGYHKLDKWDNETDGGDPVVIYHCVHPHILEGTPFIRVVRSPYVISRGVIELGPFMNAGQLYQNRIYPRNSNAWTYTLPPHWLDDGHELRDGAKRLPFPIKFEKPFVRYQCKM